MSLIGLSTLNATLSPQKITGVTGTTLTIPGGYTAPYIIISKNGSTLLPTDYTASNGTSVTLNTAAVSTDEFGVYAFGVFNVANPQFSDAGFKLYDPADAANTLDFNVAALTAPRTITVPDASGTMALQGPAFSVYRNATQSLTSGVQAKIQFNTELLDTNNFFDSSTNYRFQPTVAGWYQLNLFAYCGVQTSTYMTDMVAYILKNGTTTYYGSRTYSAISGGGSVASSLVYFNGSSDYVEGWFYASGTTPQITAGEGLNGFNGFLVYRA